MTTSTIVIYGASDDLIEIDGAVCEEFYLPQGGSADVLLVAPDGGSLVVNVGFCDRNIAGWHVAVESHGAQSVDWPMRFVPRPGDDHDPAIEIDAPAGTTVAVPGQEN